MKVVSIQDLGVEEEKLRRLFSEIVGEHELVLYKKPPVDDQELLERIESADVVITTNYPIRERTILKCEKLKHIAISFTGMDHVDVGYAEQRGIRVTNVEGYATESVSELAVAQIINSLRRIPKENEALRKGEWKGPPGNTLSGKTVGIVGLGTIGKKISQLLKPFNCKIIGTTRRENSEVEIVSLPELAKESDVVVLTIFLTKETKGIIGEELIDAMKENAIVVNVARGPVVDEECMENANVLYVPDVYGVEPLPKEHSLRKNIYATPHIGYYTEESLYEKVVLTFRNIDKKKNS